MTSIFAWNVRGFNQSRKQQASFLKIFSDTFSGGQYLHNYSHHRLGRIWVC
uniref:Uncharacterized protein n=1 Tax=Brassica oleracea TaxID=3712 RepID=A0A3P6FUD5_BRAOL|nr:unnamed protein product [Brassica oleracea]